MKYKTLFYRLSKEDRKKLIRLKKEIEFRDRIKTVPPEEVRRIRELKKQIRQGV